MPEKKRRANKMVNNPQIRKKYIMHIITILISPSICYFGKHYHKLKNYVQKINNKHSLNEWVPVKWGQEMRLDGKIWYYIDINGEVVHEIINNQPVRMENLIVYMGNPWYTVADAGIRNFKIWTRSDDGGKYYCILLYCT